MQMTKEQAVKVLDEYMGIIPAAKHVFEDRDERRWFECTQCGLTQRWSEYCKAKGHPYGPCRNSTIAWMESTDALRPVLAKLSEEEKKTLMRLLYDATDHWSPFALLTLPPEKLAECVAEAIVKAKGAK